MEVDPPTEREFRQFVEASSASLYRTAYLLTADRGRVEDLVQTALAKTYLAWHRIDDPDAVTGYARKVLVNTAISWRRRRWHGERPTAHLPEPAGPDPADRHADRDEVWSLLRTLPARQRAVLVLRYYEDLTETETARLLGITVGTVKSQTAKALRTLRRRLTEPDPAPGGVGPGPGGPLGTSLFSRAGLGGQ